MHWWIIFEIYKLFDSCQDSYWIQASLQLLLFGLGHLDNPFSNFNQFKRMAKDLKFWFIKFPVMILFGYLYFFILCKFGKIAVTLAHTFWNIFCFVMIIWNRTHDI